MLVVSLVEQLSNFQREPWVVGVLGRHVGQEAIQLHGGIGMTAEYSVGSYTAVLTALDHLLGDGDHHLADLALDDRIGFLRAGLDADVLLLDGSPLDMSSTIQRVWVNGEEIR